MEGLPASEGGGRRRGVVPSDWSDCSTGSYFLSRLIILGLFFDGITLMVVNRSMHD